MYYNMYKASAENTEKILGKGKIMGKILHNRRAWGKLLAAVLCAVITVTAIGDTSKTVSASSTSFEQTIAEKKNEVERLKKENEERAKQIKSLNGDISSNKEAMKLVTAQINGLKAEITAANAFIQAKIDEIGEKSARINAIILTIGDKEDEIKSKKLEIAELEKQNKENLTQFAKLARKMYMTHSSEMLPVLNGSDDWYNYFVYSDVVKNISGQNVLFMQRLQNSIKQQETLISELDASIKTLEADQQALENENEELKKQQAELERERTELNKRYAEQQAYLLSLTAKNAQLQDEVSTIQVKINSNEELIKQNNEEIDRLIKEAQKANKDQTVYGDGTFLWPVPMKFKTITTYFGYDGARGGQHSGLDIAGAGIHNANIYAAQSGTVIVAATLCTHLEPKLMSDRHPCGSGYGNYIVIDHGGGVTTVYGHCEKILVTQGQHVEIGDAIGLVGSAGWSTGYHLHFEVRENNVRKDPLGYQYKYKN